MTPRRSRTRRGGETSRNRKRKNDGNKDQCKMRKKVSKTTRPNTASESNIMGKMPSSKYAETLDPAYEGDDIDYDEANDEMDGVEHNGRYANDNGESSLEEEEEADEECVNEVVQNRRHMQLIKVYSQGSTLNKNETTLRTLTKSLRKIILPEVKFLEGSKVFGLFEQPDFTDPNCWQNKLYANIPSLRDANDSIKAEVWMTYKAKLKEQFSLHRSGVTLKIKRKFEEGKDKFFVIFLLRNDNSHLIIHF